MWLYDRFPKERVNQKYKANITDQFLERLRLSSVRVGLSSGSFVSSDGLIFTNHHVTRSCVQKLSSPGKDYIANGYLAKDRSAELKCPGLEVSTLVRGEDITDAIESQVTAPSGAPEQNRQRKAATRMKEKECMDKTGNRCSVLPLFGGAVFYLEERKTYSDVRLVFAPESQAGHFGGDTDNFEFPRFCLHIAFLRAYENGKPVPTPNYFSFRQEPLRAGELVFVSGHPSHTSRQMSVAEVSFGKELHYPYQIDRLTRIVSILKQYSLQSDENSRAAKTVLYRFENSLKALFGQQRGVNAPATLEQARRVERELRKATGRDQAAAREFSSVLSDLESTYAWYRSIYRRYALRVGAPGSDLFLIARHLVRLPVELSKPNAERMSPYTDAALPALHAMLYASQPITPTLETTALALYFDELKREFGDDDPTVQTVLAGRSCEEAARDYVASSRLADVAERKRLSDLEPIRSSDDGMIRLVRILDEPFRKMYQEFEGSIQPKLTAASEKLGRLRVKYLPATYPDAFQNLRLSYGSVRGFTDAAGKAIPFYTTFEGLYARATGKGEFQLPQPWLDRRGELTPSTMLNFVSTADSTSGNSGSPTLDRDGRLVGIIFDGNRESLPNVFVHSENRARSIHVAAPAIVESLRKVYRAESLLNELALSRRASPSSGGL